MSRDVVGRNSSVLLEPLRKVVVIGIGNEYRGDDGVGRAVARRLREQLYDPAVVVEENGAGAQLLLLWRDADLVICCDAMRSGAVPGTIRRIDAIAEPPPADLYSYSSHAFGLAEAIQVGKWLGELPRRMIVYAVEGAAFAMGAGLTPPVAAAVDEVVRRIAADLAAEGGGAQSA